MGSRNWMSMYGVVLGGLVLAGAGAMLSQPEKKDPDAAKKAENQPQADEMEAGMMRPTR